MDPPEDVLPTATPGRAAAEAAPPADAAEPAADLLLEPVPPFAAGGGAGCATEVAPVGCAGAQPNAAASATVRATTATARRAGACGMAVLLEPRRELGIRARAAPARGLTAPLPPE